MLLFFILFEQKLIDINVILYSQFSPEWPSSFESCYGCLSERSHEVVFWRIKGHAVTWTAWQGGCKHHNIGGQKNRMVNSGPKLQRDTIQFSCIQQLIRLSGSCERLFEVCSAYTLTAPSPSLPPPRARDNAAEIYQQ